MFKAVAGEFQSGESQSSKLSTLPPSPRLSIIPLKQIIHLFFQQDLIKPFLCDSLHDVKEQEAKSGVRRPGFYSQQWSLWGHRSHNHTMEAGQRSGASYSAWITPNFTQAETTLIPADHFWPTVSFAKSSKAVRPLLEGGMARPRWLIKNRKLLWWQTSHQEEACKLTETSELPIYFEIFKFYFG